MMKTTVAITLLVGVLMAEMVSGAEVVIKTAPPPPVSVAVVGRPPSSKYIWVPGYYKGVNGRYVWAPGKWMLPPRAGMVWVPPTWRPRPGGYVFVPGHWR
jgi:hypothetical protein